MHTYSILTDGMIAHDCLNSKYKQSMISAKTCIFRMMSIYVYHHHFMVQSLLRMSVSLTVTAFLCASSPSHAAMTST